MKTTILGQKAKWPNGHTSKILINSSLVKLAILSLCFIYALFPSKLFGQENIPYIPYSDFGSGEDYDQNLESSLQPNFMFRWPIPFVSGDFTVKVRIHYINAQGSTVPNQIISSAKSFAQSIFGEHDINIHFQTDRVYQPQDWTPSVIPNSIGVLHDGFFTSTPPNIVFEQDEIHIAIFDKHYVHSYTDPKTPFLLISNNLWTPWVNIYWKRIPHRTAAIGYPDPNWMFKFGLYDEEKIIQASLVGALGTTFGLMPLATGDPIGKNYNDALPPEDENNCNVTGDFICDTKPAQSINSINFNQSSCNFSPPTAGLSNHENNVMAFYTTAYQCIDHITEEQARKIRYVFSNDEEMHNCLTSNSTLELDNFEITPLITVISQNTTWTKPAALHILRIEDNAVFTTESSIDFAPGNYFSGYYNIGFHVPRTADYSNGFTLEMDYEQIDNEVSHAFARVDAGSRLIVYGGSLNNYYSHLPWQGIIAVGNSSEPQNTSNQAVVHFSNAVVRMAHEAIYPNDRESFNLVYHQGPRIANTTGSYVLAFDTDFINCRRVIGFRQYENIRNIGGTLRELNNLSHFTRCNILHNDDYRFSSYPIGISLNRVMGVRITGCNFENTMSNLNNIQSLHYRGDAIFAQTASFTVDENCSTTPCFNPTPSVITGYDRGLYVERTHPSLSVTSIKNTTFNYNFYSAYFGNTNLFEFEDNEVNLAPGTSVDYPTRPINNYGLYVKASTDFSIEGNTFQMANNVPTYMPITFNNTPAGIVVNSTYTEKDAAYRNTFNNLHYGIMALGQNRTNHWDGFEIRCNEFNNGIQDILVNYRDEFVENSVSHFQGYVQLGWEPQDLANNLFSHINNDPNFPSDFENHGPYWVHYARPIDPSEPRYAPIYSFRVHDMGEPDDTEREVRCPEGVLIIKMDTTINSYPRAELEILNNDYLNDLELWNQLVDNGNTPALLAEIFSYPESEYYDLFLDLMAQSPYLSDEALLEVIDLPDFPNILLRNLMMENPQVITNEELSTALIERTPALPQYMLDDIFNGTDLFGPKEALESRIAYKYGKFKRYATSMVFALTKAMAQDDENAWLTDSLLSLFDVMNTPQSKLMKATFMQNYGMAGYEIAYTEAANIAGISSDYLQGEVAAIADLLEMYYSVEDSLSSSQIELLEAIRDNDYYVAAQNMAYGMMREFGIATDSLLYDPVPSPQASNKSHRVRIDANTPISANRLKLYPNPAKEYTVLKYELKGVARELRYRMTDITGRAIMSGTFEAKVQGDEIISLPEVANGSYIISVEEMNGEHIESIRLNVFR